MRANIYLQHDIAKNSQLRRQLHLDNISQLAPAIARLFNRCVQAVCNVSDV